MKDGLLPIKSTAGVINLNTHFSARKEREYFLSSIISTCTADGSLIVCGGLCLVLVLLFSNLCPSNFTIILIGKRELVALLILSS